MSSTCPGYDRGSVETTSITPGSPTGCSSQVSGLRITTSAKSGQYSEFPDGPSRNTVPICSTIP